MGSKIYIPKMGANIESATIGKVMVSIGQRVKKGEILFQMITDKATFNVEAESDGIILFLECKENDEVSVLDEVGYIGENGETPPSLKRKSAIQQDITNRQTQLINSPTNISLVVQATPAAKKIARENGINIDEEFKGLNKIIKEQDLIDLIKNRSNKNCITVDPRKKLEIRNLLKGKEAISSSITIYLEDFLLERKIEQFLEKEKIKVTPGELISYFTAKNLKNFSKLNSCFEENKIVLHDEVNLSIAISDEDGLYVPVIKNSNNLSIKEFSSELKRLAIDIFSKKIKPEQMQDGTFTVTDLSSFGVLTFNPALNSNQSGIIGICSPHDFWKIKDSNLINGQRRHLVLVFDHRVVDGVYAAEFMNSLKRMLEE